MLYMLEVISFITLEQHQLYLIIILLLQYLVPLVLLSASTSVFNISRYYREKTTGKKIRHDFCPSVVRDTNFFVKRMYRFCFLRVAIAALTPGHPHMIQPKKISRISLLQLRLEQHLPSYRSLMLPCFYFSLQFKRSEAGTSFSVLHGSWVLWAGDVFVK